MNKVKSERIRAALAAVLVALLAAGCSMDGGGVAEEDLNKIMTCTDTRDGEKFSFNTNTVSNVRQGFGVPHSFDITTLNGQEMTLNSSMEVYLKCREDS